MAAHQAAVGTVDAPPPGSRAAEFTDDRLAELSLDDIEALIPDVADDEPALLRLVNYMDQVEASQRQWAQWDAAYEQRAAAEREAVHADFARWEAEQTAAGLSEPALRPTRRPHRRLTPTQAAREEYDTYSHIAFLRAEGDCRGTLLTPAAQRAGINPFSLFSGPYSRVRKHGSEELREWFGRNGRLTFAEYRYHSLGHDADRELARSARQNHRDEWS